jgi:hypothetical protein
MKREKYVEVPAVGAGKCPGMWSKKRLQFNKCNMNRCEMDGPGPMPCNKSMDVILLIDGSGSLGKTGWKAEIKAAQFTIDAFTVPENSKSAQKSEIAVVLYSGPRTWSGVRKCTGKDAENPDLKACGIDKVSGLTDDLKLVKEKVTALEWPQGSTLTSLALMTAKSMLALGRRHAESALIVYTDGKPLSLRKTSIASRLVRKAARLLWVPVGEFAPLKPIKKWATRRWQENVVVVKDFIELGKAEVITHIVADLCPTFPQMMVFSRKTKLQALN